VSIQRAFIVFFDFDRADITPEAARIIRAAADAAKRGNVPRIMVTGHTDLSGSVAYNQRLSERRAEAVRAQLVREGIATNAIATTGRGKAQPLVPTADGVREPQNRRAEIVLQ
jgi:outer membrane protein OmpA-like peptidoglycan-associated protein